MNGPMAIANGTRMGPYEIADIVLIDRPAPGANPPGPAPR